uniref:Nucleotidyltransferase family protein n=1 Tax=candidate division WOR-3 bacterium TaxID=2052148 RepID=A0A7C6A8K0_UNCW3
MTFEQLAVTVAENLQKSKIPYMITGALAVNYHGNPRMTHDIDLVAQITNLDIPKIKELFNNEFFVSEESINAALREFSMFNIIHKDTGLKIDFWILKGDEYSQEAFARRKLYPYQEIKISLATPEDMIISKLEWFKLSDIDKHYFDALGIYRIQKGNLDLDYINKWCKEKSVLKIWEKIRKEERG